MRGSHKGINILSSKRIPVRGLKEPLDYKIIETNDYFEYRSLHSEELHRLDGPARIWKGAGGEEWWKDGKKHRLGGPAVTYDYGLEKWYKEGKLHREDGPALTREDGSREWYFEGKYHCTQGPAVDHSLGNKLWYNHGKLHRENGPAEILKTPQGKVNEVRWYLNNEKHRLNGPAVIILVKNKVERQYWENGQFIRKEQEELSQDESTQLFREYEF